MAKPKKTTPVDKPTKNPKASWHTRNKYTCLLTQNEVFAHFVYRFSNKKAFAEDNRRNAAEAVPKILEGCGGVKNILRVSRVNMAVKLQFKSHYLIDKEKLGESGLVNLWVGDHELIAIFDYKEAKHIANSLKQSVISARNSLIEMDLD